MQNNTVFITGSNGFIGGRLSLNFLDMNYIVHGYDILPYSNIPGVIYHPICDNLVSLIDLLSYVNPGYIVHCAGNANVNYSIDHPFEDFDKNVISLYNLLYAIDKSRIFPRILFPSSAAVYGNVSKIPISEDNELKPISPYGLHKSICENICRYYSTNKKLDIIIARIFSAYGPGLKKQIFWDMHCKATSNNQLDLFGTGNESRDFIYIDDLIEALIQLVFRGKTNQVYNVAKGDEILIKDLAYSFAEQYDNSIPVYFDNIEKVGNPTKWCADTRKLNDLGFSCKVDMQEGLKRTIKWLKDEQN